MHSLASITHTNFNIPLHYSYDEALAVEIIDKTVDVLQGIKVKH